MKITELPATHPLEHIGFTGGMSYDRKNKNYRKVGEVIKKSKHFPVMEHVCKSFDLVDVSRYFVHELSKHRVLTLTVNSLRRVVPSGFISPYEDCDLTKELLASYHRMRETHRKEDARFLVPLSVKNSMSMTINIREINRVLKYLRKFDNPEFKSIVTYFENYLQQFDCNFEEEFPVEFFDYNWYPLDFKVGSKKVVILEKTPTNWTVAMKMPLAIWMQFLRHRSLDIIHEEVLDSYDPLVTDNADPALLAALPRDNPYYYLGGQEVVVVLSGLPMYWKHMMNHRLQKGAQHQARGIADTLYSSLFD
jgi:hypothetical protein